MPQQVYQSERGCVMTHPLSFAIRAKRLSAKMPASAAKLIWLEANTMRNRGHRPRTERKCSSLHLPGGQYIWRVKVLPSRQEGGVSSSRGVAPGYSW